MKTFFFPVLLVIIVGTIFFPLKESDFVRWDDDINVYKNQYIIRPSLENSLKFWQKPYAHMYIPLTYTFWAAVSALDSGKGYKRGLNPAFFHLSNVILHAINALLIYLILKLVLFQWKNTATSDKDLISHEAAAFTGAALFAIHPLQIEAVSWITGLKDVLSATFSLLALHQYLTWRSSCRLKYRQARFAGATLFFTMALLSKPSAVTLPVIALLMDKGFIQREKQKWEPVYLWFLLSFATVALTVSLQSSTKMNMEAALFWQRPFIFFDTLIFYLVKTLLPFNLAIDYGRTPTNIFETGRVFISTVAFCFLSVFLVINRKNRVWIIAFGVSVAGILPVSGLVPFAFQFFSTVADRYFYLSMTGPALAISLFVLSASRKKNLSAAIITVILLAIQSSRQIPDWKDSSTLFSHALKINSKSFVSHNNLGSEMFERGDIDNAIYYFKESIKTNPAYRLPYTNLGKSLLDKGEIDSAIFYLEKAVRLDPKSHNTHILLGGALYKKGSTEKAIHHFSEGVKADPESFRAHFNLATLLFVKGKAEEAISHFEKAIELNPQNIDGYISLSNIFSQRANEEEALKIIIKGLKYNPRSSRLQEALESI